MIWVMICQVFMKKIFSLNDIDVYRDGVSDEARTDMLDLFTRRTRYINGRAGVEFVHVTERVLRQMWLRRFAADYDDAVVQGQSGLAPLS
jgi:hypothetical protein